MSYLDEYDSADDGEVANSAQVIDEEHYSADDANLDDYDMILKVTDTSAAQARKGKDIQGIPWQRLNFTREGYRLTRLQQYVNIENIPSSGENIDKGCKTTTRKGNYFDFFFNTELVKPTFLHSQLRNLVWATSKHDVYLTSNCSVMHWSSLSQNLTEVHNFAGHTVPTERHSRTLMEGFTKIHLSTLAVKDWFLVASGFHGELVCKLNPDRLENYIANSVATKSRIQEDISNTDIFFHKCLDKPGVSFCTRVTHEENAITTSIEIFDSSGGLHFLTSNNDRGVREYDMESFQHLNHFCFPWPVNHTSVSPDRHLLTVVGDSPNGLLVDFKSGKTFASFVGHKDYSFASAWHPGGIIFATGNQDKTCRVWDLRNLSKPTANLEGNIGAVRSLRFSADGQFLVVAEAADFVHVYNCKENFEERQEIDFFGEITGVCLSPDDESLYIGVWDHRYASLLQYNKRHVYGYLDSLV